MLSYWDIAQIFYIYCMESTKFRAYAFGKFEIYHIENEQQQIKRFYFSYEHR